MTKKRRLSTSMGKKVGYELSLAIYRFIQREKRVPETTQEHDQIIHSVYQKFHGRKGMILSKEEFFDKYREKLPKKIGTVEKHGKPIKPEKKKQRTNEDEDLIDYWDNDFYYGMDCSKPPEKFGETSSVNQDIDEMIDPEDLPF